MKKLTLFLVMLLFVGVATQEAMASHLQGVDLTYECLDSCTIRVNVRIYRDCSGITPGTPNIQFIPQTVGCGQPTAVTNWSPAFIEEVTPLCATAQTQCTNSSAAINGVQEYYWFRDFNICSVPNCVYTIYWGSCCRNPSITSLTGASSTGMGIASTTLNTGIQPCNSSPQFSNPPVPYICAGQPFTFNQGAIDPEGDSLVYSLGPCFEDNFNGPPLTQVQYAPGYSATAPLGPTWNVSINSTTGDITILPNPGAVVVGVLCVYVEEYRNGTLINTIVRDVQINVLNCPANTLPLVTQLNPTGGTANGFVVNTCLGNNLCVELPAIDPDTTQSLTMWWNQNIPGATFTQTGNPTVTDTISGGPGQTLSATFCWTPPAAGLYSFLVTLQDNACPILGTNQFTVQINVGEVNPQIAISNPGCGTVTLCAPTQQGGGQIPAGPYTFQWTGPGGLSANPGATDSCLTHIYPGSGTYPYTVTVTDTNGCVGTDTGSVTVNVNVAVDAGPDISFCSGGSGTIGTPAQPGQTYNWLTTNGVANTTAAQTTVTLTNAGTTPTITPYILEVTEVSTGCIAIDTVLVTVFPIPNANFNIPPSTCDGDVVAISYTGFSDTTAIYTWNFGAGATPATATGQGPHNVVYTTPGTSTVTLSVTENGCTSPLGSQTIVVNPLPTSPFTASGPHCVNDPATITYTGSASAAGTYTFDFDGGNVVSGSGQGPYQVSWGTPGIKNITLVVTENGCTGDTTTVQVDVTTPATATAAVVDASCNGFTNGSIDLLLTGGTPNFTYSWTGPGGFTANTQDINSLGQGSYSVTVTDDANCQTVFATNVNHPALLTAQTNINPTLCFQSSDGSATVNVAGGTQGYTYLWDVNAGGQPTATATGLSAGTYSVTVTDAQNCVVTATAQVTQPTPLSISSSSNPVSCFGQSDGNATALANGGVGNYTYTWTPGGSTGGTLANQVAGTYIVVAADSNGCTINDTIDILEPAPLTATTASTPTSCALQVDNGTASVFPTGGNGGYTYLWDDPNTQTNQQATGLAAGTYNVTVTDQLGCTVVASVNVGELLPPTVSTGAAAEFCEGEGGAIVTASASGGVPGYYYTWWCNLLTCGIDSINDNDPLVNPTVSTWYYVQATDTNGCVSNIDSVFVTVLPKPIVDAGPDIFICGDSAPCVILTPTIVNSNDATGPYIYNWFPSAGLNDPTIENPCARPDSTTIYTLVVTAANGCTSDFTTTDTLSSITVHVNPVPIAEAGPDRDVCLGDSVQLEGFGTGAGPDYRYEWSPISGLSSPTIPNPMASPALTTEYVLVVYSNGCPSYGDTAVVNVHTIPTVDAGPDVETCLGGSVLLDAQASGDSTSSYNFDWTPVLALDDPTLEDPTATPDSTTWYYVTATTDWGCESEPDSALVTVLPTPIAEAGPNQTICFPNSVELQGGYYYTTTDSADVADIFYLWTPGTNLSDPSIPTPIASPDASGYYYLTVETGVCSTTDSTFITVIPDVGLNVVSDTSTACEGVPVQLTATAGIGGADFSWFPTAGLDDPTSATPIATPDQTTTYTVIAGEGGCIDTMEITVDIIPTPDAGYLSSLTQGCAPHTVSFLQASTDAINYIWNFGDGSEVSNEEQPVHTYDQPGTYVVSLTAVNSGGCASTISSMEIDVQAPPVAQFNSNEAYPVELALPNTTVDFMDASRDAVTYLWSFGDGAVSEIMNPTHSYSVAGEYMVTLEVANAIGCVDEVTHGPFIIMTPDLFIPNVFSPNADGINDEFMVEYTGSQPFNLQIFDRWGVKLYDVRDKFAGWNGTTDAGEEVQEGTYYYRVTIGDKDYAGDVTLVR